MNRSKVDALEDENVALVLSAAHLSEHTNAYRSLEARASDIIRRAITLGRSLERHPSTMSAPEEGADAIVVPITKSAEATEEPHHD
jgi:hypothetical protein